MAEEKRWVDTTTGIVTVNGVIVAVAGSVVTWFINNAASLPWFDIIAIFAGIALATFLVLSLSRPSLRNLVWGRPFRFLKSIRVTSAQRLINVYKEGEEHGFASATGELQPVLDRLEKELQKLDKESKTSTQKNIEAFSKTTEKLTIALRRNHELTNKCEELQQRLDEEQRKQRANERKAKAALPRPVPRWRIYQDQEQHDVFYLKNSVDRSVAREVRLESQNLEFLDGAHWEDASGGSLNAFQAAIINTYSNTTEIQVKVSWYDHDDDHVWEVVPIRLDLPF